MAKKVKTALIPDEIILSKIFLIRERKVMLDRDLADLYGVTTFRLNEQVKRNAKRFPNDFMFKLTKAEKQNLIDNYAHLNSLKFSPALPTVFTEHGAVMLSSVLNSERAIEVNIQIVRIFTRLRELVLTHKDILLQLEKMEQKVTAHDQDIQVIFKYLKQLLGPPEESRPRIGFRKSDD